MKFYAIPEKVLCFLICLNWLECASFGDRLQLVASHKNEDSVISSRAITAVTNLFDVQNWLESMLQDIRCLVNWLISGILRNLVWSRIPIGGPVHPVISFFAGLTVTYGFILWFFFEMKVSTSVTEVVFLLVHGNGSLFSWSLWFNWIYPVVTWFFTFSYWKLSEVRCALWHFVIVEG